MRPGEDFERAVFTPRKRSTRATDVAKPQVVVLLLKGRKAHHRSVRLNFRSLKPSRDLRFRRRYLSSHANHGDVELDIARDDNAARRPLRRTRPPIVQAIVRRAVVRGQQQIATQPKAGAASPGAVAPFGGDQRATVRAKRSFGSSPGDAADTTYLISPAETDEASRDAGVGNIAQR